MFLYPEKPMMKRLRQLLVFTGILAYLVLLRPPSLGAGTTPRAATPPAQISVRFDATSGLPSALLSRVDGRERNWLLGPLQLTLKDVAGGKTAPLTRARTHALASGMESTTEMAPLGVTISQRFVTDGDKARWDMTFTSDAPRSEHEIGLELPLLFPGAKIFTPSQYGVMDLGAYPSFKPVAYATYAWDDGQSYVLPLVTVMDPATDSALTIALPADDNIPHLQVEWTAAKVLRLTMGKRAVGRGAPTPLRILLYVHPADYRSALRAYSNDFPQYFRPALPRGPYEGTFWYHHILDHPGFEEMALQRVRYIWSAFWFTHMGEFLPPAATWYPFTYAREWKIKETMSDAKINNFIRTMHDRGIGTYAYFNVTEFGGRGGRNGDAADSDRLLQEKLNPALVHDVQDRIIPTWEGAKVINPGRNYPYWAELQEQARRHIARLPEFDGFVVDRLDWASKFDYAHSDGLSMPGSRPAENLAVPVAAAVQELCRLSHEAGKRVFVNQFWRVELLRDTDGYCHENDYLPALGYLSPLRPASAWHFRRPYDGDLLAFEGQMKRRLQWALFPQMIAHRFPISQQSPNPRAADLMEIYAGLFEPLMGKEQVLRPHCVSVSGANEANLFKNGAGCYVVPVTSRVSFIVGAPRAAAEAVVTLAVPDAAELRWAHVTSADGPSYKASVVLENGRAHIALGTHGTASMLVVGKGEEPPLAPSDETRLAGLRRGLQPSPKAEHAAGPRPTVQDVVETVIEVEGAAIGASGPSWVIDVTVDGRKSGQISEKALRASIASPASGLPAKPPVVTIDPGDEGTWFVPAKAVLIARTRAGKAIVVASWEPNDPCGGHGERGLSLPLTWRVPEEVTQPNSAESSPVKR